MKATKLLPELGQGIRRLTLLSYLTAPKDLRETLAKKQFKDALEDSNMRFRIKQAKPTDLDDIIVIAKTFDDMIKNLKAMFEQLKQQV